MFADLRKNASATMVRFLRVTSLVLGGAFVLAGLIVILSPLLLGIALLMWASKSAATPSPQSQPMVLSIG